MKTIVVDHPIVQARLRVLREASSSNAQFRAALGDLATLLVYEAARTLPVREAAIITPVAETTGIVLADPPLLVPVLRAGLGMAQAALTLLPESQMGFVGLVRDEDNHQPVPYLASLPGSLLGRTVIVLDPMIATGGSLEHCLHLLDRRGAREIVVVCVLAAPEGLARIEATELAVSIYTASIDERLNDDAFIVPGLGDAGDRQFGPR